MLYTKYFSMECICRYLTLKSYTFISSHITTRVRVERIIHLLDFSIYNVDSDSYKITNYF